MDWPDLASLANLVSSIAVVVTLAVLVVQIRQTNRNQRSIIQQARSERIMAALSEFASPHFSEVAGKLLQRKELSAAETNIYIRTLTAWFSSVEDSFLQFEAGTLDAASWESDKATTMSMLEDAAMRAAWRVIRHFFSGRYQAFIDELMLETRGAAPSNFVESWNAALAEERARASRSPAM